MNLKFKRESFFSENEKVCNIESAVRSSVGQRPETNTIAVIDKLIRVLRQSGKLSDDDILDIVNTWFNRVPTFTKMPD